MKARQHVSEFESITPWRLLVKLSVPSLVTTMIMLIYNLADVFFIGQTGDSMMVAAVSLCSPVFSLLSGLGMLFGNGGCIRVATLLGENDRDHAAGVSAFCCWGTVTLGTVMSVSFWQLKEPLLTLLGASQDTWHYAQEYLEVMVLGIPLMMFSQAMSSVLRADGQAQKPMYGNILGSVTNIILDPIFILLLGWGVKGAAVATIVANGVNCLWLIGLMREKEQVFSADPRHIRWKWSFTGKVLMLGLPMAVNTLLTSFSGVINNQFLLGYGDVVLAANGVSSKLRMIISMTAMGICIGIQPAISYYTGAKKKQQLHAILRVTAITTTSVGVLFAAALYVFRDGVIAFFIDDVAVITYGGQMVLASMLGAPFQGAYQLSASYLQGTGSVTQATSLAIIRQLLHIPLMIAGNALLGFLGLIYSNAMTTVLCAILGVVLCLIRSRQFEKRMTVQKA